MLIKNDSVLSKKKSGYRGLDMRVIYVNLGNITMGLILKSWENQVLIKKIFQNKNVVEELNIESTTVVSWFNNCRNECINLKEKIGGLNKMIVIDETCWLNQEHRKRKNGEAREELYKKF